MTNRSYFLLTAIMTTFLVFISPINTVEQEQMIWKITLQPF